MVSVMRLTWDIFGGEADPFMVAMVKFDQQRDSFLSSFTFLSIFDFRFSDLLPRGTEVCVTLRAGNESLADR